jgi:hypothetical protein
MRGKYVTLLEAGAILAGINARSHGQTYDDYMKEEEHIKEVAT